MTHRTATVHCTGRGRAGTHTRSLFLLLPGPDGTAQPLTAATDQQPAPATAITA
ncbi:hypothetical protein ACFQ0M_47700 [Kitasatospora aburaviensis]